MKILLASAALFVAVTTGWSQVDPNRVIAVVNGDEIKGAEYYRRMEFLPSNLPSNQQGLSNMPAGFLTIKQLITERLVFQLARDKGVAPTDPEVDAEYGVATKANPKLVDTWTADGRSLDDLRYQIRYELAQFKLRTAGITITDQEVEQHYKDNPTEFHVAKSYRLAVIVVRTPAEQNAADAELSSGKSFGDVAKAHSLDVSKAAGGEFGVSTEDNLAPAYRTAISATPAGKTTDWLSGSENSGNAKIKFLVEAVMPEHQQTLDADLKRNLRRKLMLDKGNVKNNVLKDLAKATVDAKIEIHQPAFQRLYEQLVAQFASAQGVAKTP